MRGLFLVAIFLVACGGGAVDVQAVCSTIGATVEATITCPGGREIVAIEEIEYGAGVNGALACVQGGKETIANTCVGRATCAFVVNDYDNDCNETNVCVPITARCE